MGSKNRVENRVEKLDERIGIKTGWKIQSKNRVEKSGRESGWKIPFLELSFSFFGDCIVGGEERNESLFMTSLFWCELTEQTPLVALERFDPLEALSTSIWSHSSDEIFESSNFELEDSSDSFRWLIWRLGSEDWRSVEELTEDFFWSSSRRRKFIVNNENFFFSDFDIVKP